MLFDCIYANDLLTCFGTAEILAIVSSAMYFKMEVNKDMGSLVSAMAD